MITGKALLAGVIGWPVSHSRSPQLHNYWLAHHGIDGAYVPLAVAPEGFEQAVRALPALGFRGANVTIPHKQAAFAVMDDVDPLAQRIGAVNTIVVQPGGALHGTNTDAYGFMANLQAAVPDWRTDTGPAVILGAGGAARAIAVGLLDAGVTGLRLVNRTKARAEALAQALDGNIEVADWSERAAALDGAGLLVNTTSLGMTGQAPLDLALDALPAPAPVADIVYAPLETDLLARARARGNPAVEGLGMLLHQAVPGFEAWFGTRPEVTDALRTHVLAA